MLILGDKTNSVAQFLTIVLLFLFVLGITWLATRYMAGIQKSKMDGSNISVVDVAKISQNGYVQILKIGEKYISICVTKDNITKLSEHSESEFVFRENEPVKVSEFAKTLQKVMKNEKK